MFSCSLRRLTDLVYSIMHKSVFITLAVGTLFHQVDDSATGQEREKDSPPHTPICWRYISSNQMLGQLGDREKKNEQPPSPSLFLQNNAANLYVKRRNDGQMEGRNKSGLVPCGKLEN